MPPPPPLSDKPLAPGLYIVATPIGNLRDITLRALDILNSADLVAAEDTRVAAKLLSAYDIKAKVRRYDDHSDETARGEILARLAAGERIALISDAGTPLISDPGFRLVAAAAAQGHDVFAAPGPSAALAALAVSGLATDRFLFAGFPPPKSQARRTAFEDLANVRATLIFYESGPRLADSLKDMSDMFGDRPGVVARELTKLHETVVRGRLGELSDRFNGVPPKGEIVVLVGAGQDEVALESDVDLALQRALTRLSPSEAAAEIAKAFGLRRKDVYRRALLLRPSPPETE